MFLFFKNYSIDSNSSRLILFLFNLLFYHIYQWTNTIYKADLQIKRLNADTALYTYA